MLGILLAGLLAAPLRAAGLENFRADAFAAAQQRGKVVVLLFHSEACPLCRTQNEAISRLLDEEFKEASAFVVDFERSPDVNERFRAGGRTTVLVFRGSYEAARASGLGSEAELRELLRKAFPTKRRGQPRQRPSNRIAPRP